MTNLRHGGHVRRGRPIEFELDGEMVSGYEGESVAAAMLALGRRTFGHSATGEPRGVFCNMGVCSECAVEVDGVAGVRACVTALRPGQRVRTT